METLTFGFFNKNEKEIFDNILKGFKELSIEYNFNKYSLESKEAFDLIKEKYSLYKMGMLYFVEDISQFYSGPLIWEISDYANSLYDNKNKVVPYPKFFQLIELMNKSNIKKFIIVFADEVDEKLGVRIENIEINNLKEKLCNFEVWEEVYYSLKHMKSYTEFYHPLVLIVSNNQTIIK